MYKELPKTGKPFFAQDTDFFEIALILRISPDNQAKTFIKRQPAIFIHEGIDLALFVLISVGMKGKIEAGGEEFLTRYLGHFFALLNGAFQNAPVAPKRIIDVADVVVGIRILPVVEGIAAIVVAKLLVGAPFERLFALATEAVFHFS